MPRVNSSFSHYFWVLVIVIEGVVLIGCVGASPGAQAVSDLSNVPTAIAGDAFPAVAVSSPTAVVVQATPRQSISPSPSNVNLRPAPHLPSNAVQSMQVFLDALNQGDVAVAKRFFAPNLSATRESGGLRDAPTPSLETVAQALVRAASGNARCAGFRADHFLVVLSNAMNIPSEGNFGKFVGIGWKLNNGAFQITWIQPYNYMVPESYWPCNLLSLQPTAALPSDAPLAVCPGEQWQQAVEDFLRAFYDKDPQLLRQRVFSHTITRPCCTDAGPLPDNDTVSIFLSMADGAPFCVGHKEDSPFEFTISVKDVGEPGDVLIVGFLVDSEGRYRVRGWFLEPGWARQSGGAFPLVTDDSSVCQAISQKVAPDAGKKNDENPACAHSPKRLEVGGWARVCTRSDSVAIRGGPGRWYPRVSALVPGAVVKVLDGPVCDEDTGWWYWHIRTQSGRYEGWMAEGGDNVDPYFLCPSSSP